MPSSMLTLGSLIAIFSGLQTYDRINCGHGMLIIPQIFQCAFLTGWEVLRALITRSFECSQAPEKGRIAKFRISQFRRETTCITIVLLRKCLQRMFMRAVLRCLCDSLFLPFWRHHRVTPPLELKFSQHFLIIYR